MYLYTNAHVLYCLYFVMCTEKFLFIAIARVRFCDVHCGLFNWSVIKQVTLNGQLQHSLFPEMDSIYRLSALRDGINEVVVHAVAIAPEHLQVLVSDDTK